VYPQNIFLSTFQIHFFNKNRENFKHRLDMNNNLYYIRRLGIYFNAIRQFILTLKRLINERLCIRIY